MNAPFNPKRSLLKDCTPDSPDEQRIAFIRQRLVVSYEAFDGICDELSEIIEVEGAEPRNIAVFASAKNGATTLAQQLVKRFPFVPNPVGDPDRVPVIYVPLPDLASLSQFAIGILSALGEPHNQRSSRASLMQSAHSCLESLQTRAIIIDNAERADEGYFLERKGMRNAINSIGQRCGASVFLFGNCQSLKLIDEDFEFRENFQTLALPRWKNDAQLQALFEYLEARYPLRKSSNLAANEEFAERVIEETRGVIGHIRILMEKCAIAAIRTGREKIDVQTLRASGWIKPEKRRKTAHDIIAPTAEEITRKRI